MKVVSCAAAAALALSPLAVSGRRCCSRVAYAKKPGQDQYCDRRCHGPACRRRLVVAAADRDEQRVLQGQRALEHAQKMIAACGSERKALKIFTREEGGYHH